MYYIVDTEKSFERAVLDLEKAVINNKFGVLHIHNLGETLRNKGVEFVEECKVFEVCNPNHSSVVMGIDMRVNMVLPCRISVYTDGGRVNIGFIKPAPMLSTLSNDEVMGEVAREVEAAIIKMVEDAK